MKKCLWQVEELKKMFETALIITFENQASRDYQTFLESMNENFGK